MTENISSKETVYPGWLIPWDNCMVYKENVLNQIRNETDELISDLTRTEALNRTLRLHPHSNQLEIVAFRRPPKGYKYDLIESDMKNISSLIHYRANNQYYYYSIANNNNTSESKTDEKKSDENESLSKYGAYSSNNNNDNNDNENDDATYDDAFESSEYLNFYKRKKIEKNPMIVIEDFEYYKLNNPTKTKNDATNSKLGNFICDNDGNMIPQRNVKIDLSSHYIPQSLKQKILQQNETTTKKNVSEKDSNNDTQSFIVTTKVFPVKLKPQRILHLTINGIKISPKAVECLSNTILDSNIYPLLTRLNMSSCAMTDKEAIALTEGLKLNKTLKSLRLNANKNISQDGWKTILFDGLLHHETLETLGVIKAKIDEPKCKIFCQFLEKNPKLMRIYFDENPFTTEMCKLLGQALSKNKNLMSLNLKRCDIGDTFDWISKKSENFCNIFEFMINEKEKLKKIEDSNQDSSETEHKMKDSNENETENDKNLIEMTRLGYICNGIGSNKETSIEWLDLTDNGIQGVNCGLALKYLALNNQSLISLSLFQNNLSDIGCKLLCEGLLENKNESRLYRLRLGYNNISYLSCKCISDMLEHLNNLSKLELQNNGLIVSGNNIHYPSLTTTKSSSNSNDNTQSGSKTNSKEMTNNNSNNNGNDNDNNNKADSPENTLDNTENRIEMNGIITICNGICQALHLKELAIDDCRLGMNGGLSLRNAIYQQHKNVNEMKHLSTLLIRHWINIINKNDKIDQLPQAIELFIVNEFLGFCKLTKLGLQRCYINQDEPGIDIVEMMAVWHRIHETKLKSLKSEAKIKDDENENKKNKGNEEINKMEKEAIERGVKEFKNVDLSHVVKVDISW